jgi:pimeloyl-ACP methyl ester carboxylesterase
MRAVVHCTWALLIVLAAPAHAQQEPASSGPTAYTVFLRGVAAGVENVTISTDANGTSFRSQARFNPPLNITLRSSEIRYTPDWTPVSFSAEGSFNGLEAVIRASFQNGTATIQGTEGGTPTTQTQPVSPKVVLLPNAVFAGYLTLAKRLATDPPGVELRAYVPTQVEFPIRVTAVTNSQAQVGTNVFPVRQYDLIFAQPSGDLAVTLTATAQGDLVRLSVASQSLEIVRSDLASPTSRTQVFSNPGDEAVIIPLEGFNLGATVTHPRGAGAAARMPAVVLLAAANVNDRDGVMSGVPTLGQLAGALAEAGFLAVRYDKRGYGQSGGRSESATLLDQAEDARAVVRWLSNRKDVDPKRIAVVGHGEGAMVGLVAASREAKIAAVVSIASPSTPGTEQFLEQQRLAVEASNLPQSERDKRLALQRQVQEAVLTGKGWEGVPADIRRAADTPWFQSVLAYDPAKVLKDVRQPLLIVHGEMDREAPVAHAEKLAALARDQGKSKSVDLVIVRGVNHLLAPAVTGNTSEYGTLTDRNVSKDVLATVTGWLTKTLPAAQR